MGVIVDGRWDGHYGIGRVGREVRRRLGAPQAFYSDADPLSPRGIAELWLYLRGRNDEIFWSPGFAGTAPQGVARQVLTVWDLVHLGPMRRTAATATYYAAIVRPAILRTGVVMTGSHAGAGELRRWLGRRAEKVTFVPIGCGVSEAFGPKLETRDPGHVVLVGNLQPHKNVGVALHALSRLPEIRATWVVNDIQRARLLLHKTGLESRVNIVSGISDSDLARLYARSAALLFPSVSEGFGLPPLEAAACGTPVVYFAGCESVRETCGDDPAHHAVGSADDAEAWRSAIELVMATPRNAAYPARYTWDAVTSRVGSVLEMLGG